MDVGVVAVMSGEGEDVVVEDEEFEEEDEDEVGMAGGEVGGADVGRGLGSEQRRGSGRGRLDRVVDVEDDEGRIGRRQGV